MIALLMLLSLVCSAHSRAADALPYDESADAAAQVTAAAAQAARDGKQLLIVFGANWCGDCKMLDAEFKKPALKALLDRHYRIVKVDVGRFNKNLDVVKPWGDVIRKGIPSIVVAGADRQLIYATHGGELADARKMGEAGVMEFFSSLAERTRGPVPAAKS